MSKEQQLLFQYDEIYPIAMIQVKEILEDDIATINEYGSFLAQELPNYSKQDLWIAYERCGYNAEAIPGYIHSGGSLELLPFHIQKKEYDLLSPCRRDAIRSMYSNTNTYFYRNRPPGEEPMYGEWTEEEQAAFHDRLMLFQHFGIAEKHWGIFAVKTKRFGYTCSQYYKKQYDPNKFKDRPLPEFPDVPETEILDWLKQEAFEYIKSCILKSASNKDAVIKSGTPRTTFLRTKSKAQLEKQESSEEKTKQNSSDHEDSSPVIERTAYQTLTKDKYEMLSSLTSDGQVLRKNHGKRKSLISPSFPPQISGCSLNLALGAIDKVTGQPMRTPMVNRDGYVLDKQTWEMIISGKVDCPYDIMIPTINDLMELTNENFNKYRPYLINVFC